MRKYKVYFGGFAYVEAESESFAELAYEEEDTIYEECEVLEIVEVEDFTIDI